MRAQNTLFRITAWAAVTGMVLGPALPVTGLAQGAPPPPPGAGAPAADQGPEVNPPSRVGRLAWTQGTVSFHAGDQDSWSPAVVNYPVTSGTAFWTQPGAQAGIEVSDVLVAMNAATELDVDTLDDASFLATEPQGEVYVQVAGLAQGESYTLQTPRGTVTIAAPGRYEIAAGTTDSPTLITVLDGAAQVIPGGSVGAQTSQPLDVPTGQTAAITGEQTFQAQLEPAVHDAFLDAMVAGGQRAVPAPNANVPAVVAQMPGGAELGEYGSWSQTPDYGQVWYPQVASNWVPYREGSWSYVAPWGWTWVDSDPWGFAPFHYGRWVYVGNRWGWSPGAEAVADAPPYPVYAPALVTFFDIGAAAAVGVGIGLAAGALFNGSVGWVPCGYNEPWHPWFRSSPEYFRRANIRNVTNITRISNTTVNNVTINNFRNARGATVVPAAAMVTSRPIQSVARAVRPQELTHARPVIGRAPVPPTTATLGVTPAVARQMHIAAPPAGMAVTRRVAPGPAIRPQTIAASQPGQRPPRPELRGPTTPASAGVAGVPHAPAVGRPETMPPPRPGGAPGPATTREPAGVAHGMPALRPPGEGRAGPPPIQHEPGRTAITEPRPTAVPAAPGAAVRPTPERGAPLPRVAGPGIPPAREAPGAITREAPGGVSRAAPIAARPGTPPVVHEAPRPAPSPHQAPRPTAMPEAAAPRPAPAQRPAPAPEVHAAAPPPATLPHPAPQIHAAAPAVIHPAAPPPRPAPPAAAPPAPAPHPAPAPAPAPAAHQAQHQKRPGEP